MDFLAFLFLFFFFFNSVSLAFGYFVCLDSRVDRCQSDAVVDWIREWMGFDGIDNGRNEVKTGENGTCDGYLWRVFEDSWRFAVWFVAWNVVCVDALTRRFFFFFNEKLGGLIRDAVHKSPVTWICRIDVN